MSLILRTRKMIKLKVNTDQEAFDLVMKSIHKQKVPSIKVDVKDSKNSLSCLYAGKGKHRCAIGHLLDAPKSKLKKLDKINVHLGTSIDGLIATLEVDSGGIDIDFLAKLQECHDRAAKQECSLAFIEKFDEDMNAVANEYKLDTENWKNA